MLVSSVCTKTTIIICEIYGKIALVKITELLYTRIIEKRN